MEKYPQSSTGLFTSNSDIHYFIKIIDNLKEQYEVKATKIEEKLENSEIKKSQQSPFSIPENSGKEEKTENKKDSLTLNSSPIPIPQEKAKEKENNIGKKLRFSENDEIKKLRMKIKSNISRFLEEFIEENKLKRANSMMSLRSSKTISSETTCDDSIYFDDTNIGRHQINKKNLIIDNNETNLANQKTKDMIQRSKNLYQVYLDQQKETKGTKNKFGKLTGIGMQKPKGLNLLINMTPKFKEIEEEMEGINIEYNENNKNVIESISIDLLLKKIIFENFLDKYSLLIYHFCQQCFCFVSKEILFKKLIDCYKIYINKKIPLDKLKNLIEFISILIIEMFEYYDKIDFKEMQIGLIKRFYNELICDLIVNFKEEDEENKIGNKINNVNAKNDNERYYRFNSIDLAGENKLYNNITDTDVYFDKINLLKTDLNLDIKKINIFFFQNRKEQIIDWNCINEKGNKEKEKEKNKETNQRINIELPKIYHISKTLKKSVEARNINEMAKNKYLGKIEEDIKEENNEEDVLYSDNENNEELGKKEKEDYSFEELKSSSEEEEINNIKNENKPEEKTKSEIIVNILSKVFKNNNKIISTKEDLMNEIKYILALLDVKDKENIFQPYLREAKSGFPFYADIKTKKKLSQNSNNQLKNSNSLNLLEKSRTNSISDFSLRLSSINNITNIKNYFCITDWSPGDIGDKLIQVTKSLLNEIKPRELYKGIYLKKDKEKTSPNVVKCINSFNKLTSFIIEDILSYSTPRLRARSYERWVQICEYCKSNKNYNDCIAIFSALNNFIITGLSLTLKEVKYKTKAIFEQISLFCSVEGNYKNIRNEMNLCEQKGESFIPYLGMLLRDINFVEESNNYINEKGCINMNKIEKINTLLEKYFNYKKDDKKKIEDKIISKDLSFFQNLEILTEEELENIAKNVEPEYKYDKTVVKRLTNNDKKWVEKNTFKKRSIISGIRPNFLAKSLTFSKSID